MLPIDQTVWFQSLPEQLQQQVELSFQLLERQKQVSDRLVDYSFVVFPMAKAYEGYLKHYFFSRGLINQQTLESKRFRIGRSLNPDLPQNQRDERWLFDDVAASCTTSVARELWEAWLSCRNRLFHYFPNHPHALTLPEAEQHIRTLAAAMDSAAHCPVK